MQNILLNILIKFKELESTHKEPDTKAIYKNKNSIKKGKNFKQWIVRRQLLIYSTLNINFQIMGTKLKINGNKEKAKQN